MLFNAGKLQNVYPTNYLVQLVIQDLIRKFFYKTLSILGAGQEEANIRNHYSETIFKKYRREKMGKILMNIMGVVHSSKIPFYYPTLLGLVFIF